MVFLPLKNNYHSLLSQNLSQMTTTRMEEKKTANSLRQIKNRLLILVKVQAHMNTTHNAKHCS
jgi:hypothetical protein